MLLISDKMNKIDYDILYDAILGTSYTTSGTPFTLPITSGDYNERMKKDNYEYGFIFDFSCFTNNASDISYYINPSTTRSEENDNETTNHIPENTSSNGVPGSGYKNSTTTGSEKKDDKQERIIEIYFSDDNKQAYITPAPENTLLISADDNKQTYDDKQAYITPAPDNIIAYILYDSQKRKLLTTDKK